MYCEKCGKQLKDGVPFCKYCGAKQKVQQERSQSEIQSDRQKNGYQPGEVEQGQQPNYVQSDYRQNGGYQQNAYPQSSYNQGDYWQNDYPQSSYNQGDYHQNGYPQGGYQQGDYLQNGYPQNYGQTGDPQAYQQPHRQSQGNHLPQGHGVHRAAEAGSRGVHAAGAAVRGGRKAAQSAITIKLLAIIAVVLIVIAGLLYFFFFSSKKPEDTVEKLEKAMNELDQDALLECFDGQMNDLYSGMLGIGGELTGIDLGSWADLASGLGGIMSAAGLSPQVELTVIAVEYTGSDSCVVTVDFKMTYMGEVSSETQYLPMVKEGREWLISMSGLSDWSGLGF